MDFPWTTDNLPQQIDNLNYYLQDLALIDYAKPVKNGANDLVLTTPSSSQALWI